MPNKLNKRKIVVEKGSNSLRPSVFERLGIKPEQRNQAISTSGCCRHWNKTGTCPYGSSCQNAMHHSLISPSKQRAVSKETEPNNRIKKQGLISSSALTRLQSSIISVKNTVSPAQLGTASQHWEEDWSETSLAHIDEKELERRKQQLQRELDIQMKEEMRKRKISGTASNTKKISRSTTSSSSSSSGSSSSSSGSSSGDSSSSHGHKTTQKSRFSKQKSRKKSNMKKIRDDNKDANKKKNTSCRPDSSSRQHSQPNSSNKKRHNSSSPDSSESDHHKVSRPSSRQRLDSNRTRGSRSIERKFEQDRKKLVQTQEKKRRDPSPAHKFSASSSRGVPSRKRSITPRLRKRSPSPMSIHQRSSKQHDVCSRNNSPQVRRRSLSQERNNSRRGHTPSSPSDRNFQHRSGRDTRRCSPDNSHRNQINRQRSQGNRDSRLSPERHPRASSRETVEKRGEWSRGRDYGNRSSPPRTTHRSSPDSSNGSSSRHKEIRSEKLRQKDHERDRDQRREAPPLIDKGREKVRSRVDEVELPSLLSITTQHPGHFQTQQHPGRRIGPRDDSNSDHRNRDRGRYDRYETERSVDSYSEHGDDRTVSSSKRGPVSRRDVSPQRQRSGKPRDWQEGLEARGREWDRRLDHKSSLSGINRQWTADQSSEDQTRLLPPANKRNVMQHSTYRGTASSSKQPSVPSSPSAEQTESLQKPETRTAENNALHDATTNQDLEVHSAATEISQKRHHGDSIDVLTEPACKRPCIEEQNSESPLATQPAPTGLDLLESDLSDISDEADEILNAELIEEAREADENVKGTCEEDDDEEAVDDILDNMDFEEISDGELEAEEGRNGIDAVTVDWADLLNQTKNREGEENKEARTHRWQSSQLLARLGVSVAHCSPSLLEKLKITILRPENSCEEIRNCEEIKLLNPIPCIHVAFLSKKKQRSSLFQLSDRTGLSSADDLKFRQQLNGLPRLLPEYHSKHAVEPDFLKQALEMFTK